MQSASHTLRGIGLMIAAMACFAAMNVAVRWVAETMHPMQMVVLRNLIGLILIVVWIFMRYGPAHFRTTRPGSHFSRAFLGFLAMETWFYSLSILPLTLATALSFTTPIFSTIFAIWLLGEKAGVRRWCAIIVGFIGVLVILRPDAGGLDMRAGLVLISSAIMGLAGTIIKSLTRTEPPETIVFYMALYMTPLSLPPALFHWQPVAAPEWAGLALIAFFSTAAHLLLARAYTHTEMVVLMPFDFTRLLFTALLAYLFFNETIDSPTLLGALIIAGSTVYIARREAQGRSLKPPLET